LINKKASNFIVAYSGCSI